MIGKRVIARVLDNALADAECEIQPAEFDITAFEMFDDAQGVQIVIEAQTVFAQGFVEGAFAGVPNGGCPMSWTRASDSASASLRFSAPATVRAICATSIVCVRRLRKWSE